MSEVNKHLANKKNLDRQVRNYVFALGFLGEFAALTKLLWDYKNAFNDFELGTFLVMFIVLLFHHWYIFDNFQEMNDKTPSDLIKDGFCKNWIESKLNLRLSVTIFIIFSGLSGEIPYAISTLLKVFNYDNTKVPTVVFIGVSFLLTILNLWWDIKAIAYERNVNGKFETHFEEKKKDSTFKNFFCNYRPIAMFTLCDTLSFIAWGIVLFLFLLDMPSGLVTSLAVISSLYLFVILWRFKTRGEHSIY